MPSRFALWTLIALAGVAQPCFAQKVISKHPPLAPDEAVRVLRSSHSLADMANRPLIDPDGPHIYVLPYDPSVDVPPMMAPDALGPDGIPLMPYGGMYGGMYGGVPYAPYAAYGRIGSPFFSRDHIRPFVAAPRVTPVTAVPHPPSRSIVTGSASGGKVTGRRR